MSSNPNEDAALAAGVLLMKNGQFITIESASYNHCNLLAPVAGFEPTRLIALRQLRHRMAIRRVCQLHHTGLAIDEGVS
jgi:hypothetical protein